MTQGWFGPVGRVRRKLSGQAEPHPKGAKGRRIGFGSQGASDTRSKAYAKQFCVFSHHAQVELVHSTLGLKESQCRSGWCNSE